MCKRRIAAEIGKMRRRRRIVYVDYLNSIAELCGGEVASKLRKYPALAIRYIIRPTTAGHVLPAAESKAIEPCLGTGIDRPQAIEQPRCRQSQHRRVRHHGIAERQQ